jgi:hypothetical protein
MDSDGSKERVEDLWVMPEFSLVNMTVYEWMELKSSLIQFNELWVVCLNSTAEINQLQKEKWPMKPTPRQPLTSFTSPHYGEELQVDSWECWEVNVCVWQRAAESDRWKRGCPGSAGRAASLLWSPSTRNSISHPRV